MSFNKKVAFKFRLTNRIIWIISVFIWLAVTIFVSTLTTSICQNRSASFCEIFSWIGKAINILLVFNIVAMADVSTTPIKIKAVSRVPMIFSKYEILYETHTKNIIFKVAPLDNLFKKISLFGMCKPGRYLGFLLLKYLK